MYETSFVSGCDFRRLCDQAASSEEAGIRQFLVADPDGYLIRYQCSTGRRTVSL